LRAAHADQAGGAVGLTPGTAVGAGQVGNVAGLPGGAIAAGGGGVE
jgi:hypothetical protein